MPPIPTSPFSPIERARFHGRAFISTGIPAFLNTASTRLGYRPAAAPVDWLRYMKGGFPSSTATTILSSEKRREAERVNARQNNNFLKFISCSFSFVVMLKRVANSSLKIKKSQDLFQ